MATHTPPNYTPPTAPGVTYTNYVYNPWNGPMDTSHESTWGDLPASPVPYWSTGDPGGGYAPWVNGAQDANFYEYAPPGIPSVTTQQSQVHPHVDDNGNTTYGPFLEYSGDSRSWKEGPGVNYYPGMTSNADAFNGNYFIPGFGYINMHPGEWSGIDPKTGQILYDPVLPASSDEQQAFITQNGLKPGDIGKGGWITPQLQAVQQAALPSNPTTKPSTSMMTGAGTAAALQDRLKQRIASISKAAPQPASNPVGDFLNQMIQGLSSGYNNVTHSLGDAFGGTNG